VTQIEERMRSLDKPAPHQAETFWEQQAETVWGRYISDVERAAIEKANALSEPPTLALEVGCDGGRWSCLLSDLGWSLVCTDVESRSLEICRQRLPAATTRLVLPDDRSLPCHSQAAGLLLCLEVFPVMPERWFLTESVRVLRPGGYLVGVFNNRRSWRGLLHHVRARLSGRFSYYSTSYKTWKKWAQASGLTIASEEGICWFPFHRSSNSSFAPAFIFIERFLGLRKLADLSPWVVFVAQKA
jgi:SAM-dependent methyltransferase